MVQILPKVESFGSQFGRAFGGGAGRGFSAELQSQQELKKISQENAEIKKQTGIDLSGFKDPETRRAVFIQELKGKQKREQEEKKEDFLSKLFGGGQPSTVTPTGFGKKLQGASSDTELPSQKQINPLKISDEDILQATSIDKDLGKALRDAKGQALEQKRHEQNREDKEYYTTRSEEAELAKPLMNELNQIRKNIPLQEQAIEDIKTATPEVGGQDWFAEITGFEPLRTSSGAKLKTAIKDFFLSDLSRAGARPNMWIEQQLADALPKIGRSAEANLITAEGINFKVDLAKKRVELMDQIAERDKERLGYIEGSTLDKRAYQQMKPYIEQRQNELKERIEQIKSQQKLTGKMVPVIGPNGEEGEIDVAEVGDLPEGWKVI